MKLEIYRPKIEELLIGEYLDLYDLGMLPFQDRAPSDHARKNTREIIATVHEQLEGPTTTGAVIEYLAHGMLEDIITPIVIFETHILEPSLILGGYRLGNTIRYEELSKRLDEKIEAWAHRILVENRR